MSRVATLLLCAIVLGCLALPNRSVTEGQASDKGGLGDDAQEGSSIAMRPLIVTFAKISVMIVALYLWGLTRKEKSFKDMSSGAPKSFVSGLKDVEPPADGYSALDPNLWYIHGQAYDITSFMSRHPGGTRPLIVARGRDCTELFESYHSLTDTPKKMLEKFKVPGKTCDHPSMFNWDPNAPCNKFQNELRARVKAFIAETKLDTRCPPKNLFFIVLWTLFTMWMTWEFYWVRGSWWAALVVPPMWWGSFIQTFHDATHFSFSRNQWIQSFFVHFYPYFTSPTTWDHQHVIGHHVFTNIFKKDPDVSHGIGFIRIHPQFRFKTHYAYQMYFWWVVWLISSFWLGTVYDWTGVSSGSYHGLLPYQKMSPFRMGLHLFGRVMGIFLTIGIPFTIFSFWKALFWAVTFNGIWGLLFMIITQTNHIVEECLEGAEQKNESWSVHQVVTSHDFSHTNWWWWLISGGLNYQIEHHLFPGIGSAALPKLVPIVKELCKKYDIPFNYSPTYTEAFSKYLEVVRQGSLDKDNSYKRD